MTGTTRSTGMSFCRSGQGQEHQLLGKWAVNINFWTGASTFGQGDKWAAPIGQVDKDRENITQTSNVGRVDKDRNINVWTRGQGASTFGQGH
eukprot:5927889-Pyramimonas_sp.AAC.1